MLGVTIAKELRVSNTVGAWWEFYLLRSQSHRLWTSAAVICGHRWSLWAFNWGCVREKNGHGQEHFERGCRHLGLHRLTPSSFNDQEGLTCARKSQTRLGCIGVQGTPIWHGSWEPARCSCVSYSGFSSHYVLLFGQLQPPLSAWILLLHSLYCLYSKRKSGFKVTATFAGNYYFYFLSSSSAANARAAQSCHFLPAVISFQNGRYF